MNPKPVERVGVVVCLVSLWVGCFLVAPNESAVLEVCCPQQM